MRSSPFCTSDFLRGSLTLSGKEVYLAILLGKLNSQPAMKLKHQRRAVDQPLSEINNGMDRHHDYKLGRRHDARYISLEQQIGPPRDVLIRGGMAQCIHINGSEEVRDSRSLPLFAMTIQTNSKDGEQNISAELFSPVDELSAPFGVKDIRAQHTTLETQQTMLDHLGTKPERAVPAESISAKNLDSPYTSSPTSFPSARDLPSKTI